MCKILIADDEYLEIEALKVIINRSVKDATVVGEAHNGKQVVEMDNLLNPDVIFMDIEMPVMNGIEAAEIIKKNDKNKMIILISAYENFEFAQRAIRINVNDYLLKPIRPEKVVAILRRFIDNDNRYYLRQNKVMLLKSIKNYNYRESKDTVQKIIMYFKNFNLDEVKNYSINLINSILILTNIKLEKLSQNYKKILKYSIDIESIANCLKIALDDIFDKIMENKDLNSQSELECILNYIEKNFKKDIMLKDVANYVNLSTSYLSKFFKKNLNINFNEYITNRRIEEAKKILTYTDVTVNELTFNIGYSEPNYFCRVFKKETGMTPIEYRKNTKC